MDAARAKSAALWGAVGTLSFPVLALAYQLLAGPLPLGIPGLLVVALAIGAAVAIVAYGVEDRLTRKGRT